MRYSGGEDGGDPIEMGECGPEGGGRGEGGPGSKIE